MIFYYQGQNQIFLIIFNKPISLKTNKIFIIFFISSIKNHFIIKLCRYLNRKSSLIKMSLAIVLFILINKDSSSFYNSILIVYRAIFINIRMISLISIKFSWKNIIRLWIQEFINWKTKKFSISNLENNTLNSWNILLRRNSWKIKIE
jgi:hypothetical protein